MSRIAYVNGRYVPHRAAAIHIEDRAVQFADSVYEVCEVKHGKLIDEARHMERLRRSLSELRIANPVDFSALGVILREVVRRNRVVNGIVYLQVTRGTAPRNHYFPPPDTRPGLVVTARSVDQALGRRFAGEGVSVVTVPDNRWDRVDIKSTALLPNVLAKQKARESGAFEAWFVDEAGFITEGSSTNAWIVDEAGVLLTRPADHGILRGITRAVVLEAAAQEGVPVEERPFTLDGALRALEAFLTASSTIVMPIVSIDGQPVADGRPGALSTRLRKIFHDYATSSPVWATLTSRTGED